MKSIRFHKTISAWMVMLLTASLLLPAAANICQMDMANPMPCCCESEMGDMANADNGSDEGDACPMADQDANADTMLCQTVTKAVTPPVVDKIIFEPIVIADVTPVNPAVLVGHFDSDSFLDKGDPPEIHLLLGVFLI